MSINYSLSVKNPPLDKDKEHKKMYAIAQHAGVLDADKFIDKVCKRYRSYDEGEVYGVLYAVTETLRRMLLDGYRVEAGPLGDFYTVIHSRGSQNRANFARSNIKDVTVNFTPGKRLSDLMREAKFKQVMPKGKFIKAKREVQKKSRADFEAESKARKEKKAAESEDEKKEIKK